MQQIFDQNQQLIGLVVGVLVNSVLSLVFRKLPTNAWAIQIVRMILQSGNSFANQVVVAETKPAQKPPSIPPAPLAAALFIGLLLSGCTMSLEAARADGIRHRAAQSPPALPATGPGRAECKFLDDTQRIFSYGGITFAAIGAGAGAVAAATDGDTKKGAVWTAAVAGGVDITFWLLQKDFEAKWTELCGQ